MNFRVSSEKDQGENVTACSFIVAELVAFALFPCRVARWDLGKMTTWVVLMPPPNRSLRECQSESTYDEVLHFVMSV